MARAAWGRNQSGNPSPSALVNERKREWKADLPGEGHSSPIVWENRLFLLTCLPESQERVLVSLDRKDGKILWQRTVVKAPLEGKHPFNSFASSTPATDGKRVYVTFLDQKEMLIAAYDFEGQPLWTVRPGTFSSKHGFCSNPVLFENKVIVNGDHDGDAFVVAVNRETGKTEWKIPRENKTRSYSTPLIREIGGRTQMIMSGNQCVASYDPHNGKQHWLLKGPTEQFVASVVYHHDLVFMTCGFPDMHILAIKPDGTGLISDAQIPWRTQKGAGYVPSPVVADKYLFVVTDGGIASCFEATTGKRLWMQRIGTHFSGSPVTAEGLVYFTDDDTTTTIVKPGEKLDVVATNKLAEPFHSSPAISQGEIFFRTQKHLYCIAGAAGTEQAAK
ncbi:MAG: PQQ-binding-like beta-propeller repeat protein [Planctomycetales bacterium]